MDQLNNSNDFPHLGSRNVHPIRNQGFWQVSGVVFLSREYQKVQILHMENSRWSCSEMCVVFFWPLLNSLLYGTPIAGWFVMEHPLNMDDLVPYVKPSGNQTWHATMDNSPSIDDFPIENSRKIGDIGDFPASHVLYRFMIQKEGLRVVVSTNLA